LARELLSGIEHIVVLMLENRSFDNLLGWLYPERADFDGLTGRECNPWHRGSEIIEIPVWNDKGLGRADVRGPLPDPGELFTDIEMQFWGAARMGLDGRGRGAPDMSGFVDNYMRQPRAFDGTPADPHQAMHCLSPDQVPIISLLGRSFAVSDRWFASAPCQTWPNRFFVHCGTAGGWINNQPTHYPYRMPSLFRRLSDHRRSWAIYFHDIPQTATISDLQPKLVTSRFRLFHREFDEDAAAGKLPAYSFIEPRYFVSRFRQMVPNDQHPPSYIVHGEELIAHTYNALRQSPCWPRTLFLVLYDEHGGLYDHVPPPEATPPGPPYPDGFKFDRFGARVACVVISPQIPAGSVIRPQGTVPFDHTSVIKTVQELFDLGPPLTPRVAAAPSLLPHLDGRAGNDGPPRIDYIPVAPRHQEVARLRAYDNKSGVQLSLANSAAFALGTVARINAHLRHGAKRAVRRRRRGDYRP
jgi:phospholipase C